MNIVINGYLHFTTTNNTISVCAGLRRNGVPGTPFLCKSGVLLMGFNSLYVKTFTTCGTLMRP